MLGGQHEAANGVRAAGRSWLPALTLLEIQPAFLHMVPFLDKLIVTPMCQGDDLSGLFAEPVQFF